MTLDQLIVALSNYQKEFAKSKVVYKLTVGKSNSMLIWDVYPEVFEDSGEVYIVISNIHHIEGK